MTIQHQHTNSQIQWSNKLKSDTSERTCKKTFETMLKHAMNVNKEEIKNRIIQRKQFHQEIFSNDEELI